MRKCKFLLILFSLFASLAQAETCSDKACPGGRQPTTICFNHPETTSGLWRPSAAAACGYFTEIIIATDLKEVTKSLDQLAKSCKSLDRMTIFGHGMDGYHQTGSLHSGSVQTLKGYACLFNQDAKVQFVGCNVGRGCAGDMLLYQTAKSLLGKGGTVTAPTFYASTALPGIWPHSSLNFKSRVLNYEPSRRPPDKWTQSGLAISDGGNINKRCSEELDGLIKDTMDAKADAKAKKCDTSDVYVTDRQMASFEKLKGQLTSSPSYLENANSNAWHDLRSALTALDYQIYFYETCEPASKKTQSSEAVQ